METSLTSFARRQSRFDCYLFLLISVNLIVISCGLGLAWPSPVLVKLRSETQTILPRPITEDEGSWIVSVASLTTVFANSLTAVLVDRIGRKNCIILACLIRIIIGLLYTFATRLWMLILGRVLNGISMAFIFIVVSMYASEISSKEVRGSLGAILQIFSSFGSMVMLSMGPVVSYLTLNIVFTSVALLATVPVFFLPDSPYFLYSKGQTLDAIKTLTFLRGSETAANEEIKEYAVSNTDSSVNKLILFRDRIFIKTLIIVVVLGAGFQLMGFNAVSFYLQTVLESSQSSIRPEVGSAIIGAIQLGASICTIFITDRFGRKPILMITIIATCIGMLGLGVFFYLKGDQQIITGVMNYMPLVSLVLVVFGYSAGPGSLYWMLIAELFDGAARGVGVSVSVSTANLFIFLTSKFFPQVTTAFGPAATYWTFSIMCVLMALVIVFCVPETKGRSFAEIQQLLGAEKRACENGSREKDGDIEKNAN